MGGDGRRRGETDFASTLAFRSTVAWDPRRAFSMFDAEKSPELGTSVRVREQWSKGEDTHGIAPTCLSSAIVAAS